MLVRLVESGRLPAIHGVVRWRLRDLAWWVFEEFRINLDKTTVGHELRKLDYRKLSVRPQHSTYAGGKSAGIICACGMIGGSDLAVQPASSALTYHHAGRYRSGAAARRRRVWVASLLAFAASLTEAAAKSSRSGIGTLMADAPHPP